MNCGSIVYSDHSVIQMFKRDIATEDVSTVIDKGEIINEYLYDRPYPSYLLLGFVNMRPLHVVLAKDDRENKCIIVTVYQPDKDLWDSSFRKKRS